MAGRRQCAPGRGESGDRREQQSHLLLPRRQFVLGQRVEELGSHPDDAAQRPEAASLLRRLERHELGNRLLPPSQNVAISQAEAALTKTSLLLSKYRLGKLPGVAAIVGDLGTAIADQNFTSLPITVRHGQVAGALPGTHRDPFDRTLIAQAMLEGLVLLSNERTFDAYGVGRLW